MEKFEIRTYIKGRAAHGISPLVIYSELKHIHGSIAPAYSTVVKWTAFYKGEWDSLLDSSHSGRPITTVATENIDHVRKIIVADPPINTSLEAHLNALFKTAFTYSYLFLVLKIIEIL